MSDAAAAFVLSPCCVCSGLTGDPHSNSSLQWQARKRVHSAHRPDLEAHVQHSLCMRQDAVGSVGQAQVIVDGDEGLHGRLGVALELQLPVVQRLSVGVALLCQGPQRPAAWELGSGRASGSGLGTAVCSTACSDTWGGADLQWLGHQCGSSLPGPPAPCKTGAGIRPGRCSCFCQGTKQGGLAPGV